MSAQATSRVAGAALLVLIAAGCAPPNASERFHAPTDADAARICLSRGYRYVQRVYPSDARCLSRFKGGPEVFDAQMWLDSAAKERQP